MGGWSSSSSSSGSGGVPSTLTGTVTDSNFFGFTTAYVTTPVCFQGIGGFADSSNRYQFLFNGSNGNYGLVIASNLPLSWSSVDAIGASSAGPFQSGTDLRIRRATTGVLTVDNGSSASFGAVKTTATTVASLPSASTVGAGTRAFVTDATAPTFGATVAGSGTVATPVYSDGTNWKVG